MAKAARADADYLVKIADKHSRRSHDLRIRRGPARGRCKVSSQSSKMSLSRKVRRMKRVTQKMAGAKFRRKVQR